MLHRTMLLTVMLLGCGSGSPSAPACLGSGSDVDAGMSDADPGGVPAAGSLALGWTHSCAASGSRLECWGANEGSQIGDGSTTTSRPPVAVSLRDVSAVAGGRAHTCAIAGEAVHCWGQGERGQLGIGSGNRPLPARVSGVAQPVALALGEQHSCVLECTGKVKCWGANDRGQLGRTGEDQVLPASVENLPDAIAISSFGSYTCVVGTDASVWCWGDNSRSQIPNAPMGTVQPRRVASDAAGVAVGRDFGCLLSTSGEVQCWGTGPASGSLGTRSNPISVAGLGRATAIAAGGAHACAITIDGTRCWGAGTSGQLANGASLDSSAPTVMTLEGVVQLALGDKHTCALTEADEVYCAGNNTMGELGIGAGSSSNVMRRVP